MVHVSSYREEGQGKAASQHISDPLRYCICSVTGTIIVCFFVFGFLKVAGRSYDFNLEQVFVNNSGLYVFHETESQADKEMNSAERRETVGENKALSLSRFPTCIA